MQARDYGPFPYLPIHQRPKVSFPGGARVALWIIPNLEFFSLRHGLSGHPTEAKGNAPTVRPWALRDYGNRVGIWRIMDLLNKLNLRASPTLNTDICEHHPQIVQEGMKLGWEFLGHNKTNTQRLTEMDAATERQTIEDCARRIEQMTGVRPRGWLGAGLAETWNTLDNLIDSGFQYVADWTNDDQPYTMTMDDGRKITSVPYSYEVNDSPFLYYRNGTIDEFEKLIKRQFDVLYEEGAHSGRVMAICLHPYIIGVPHRIKALESALRYIQSHDQVWYATGSEIAAHHVSSGVKM